MQQGVLRRDDKRQDNHQNRGNKIKLLKKLKKIHLKYVYENSPLHLWRRMSEIENEELLKSTLAACSSFERLKGIGFSNGTGLIQTIVVVAMIAYYFVQKLLAPIPIFFLLDSGRLWLGSPSWFFCPTRCNVSP